MAGDVDEAVRVTLEGQQRYEELGITDTTILPFLAHALYVAGRWEEAEAPARRAIAGEQPLWKTLGQITLARIHARRGRLEEAEALAGEALGATRRTDYPIWLGRALLGLAEILDRLGRHDEAAARRDEAVRVFERKGATVWANLARAATSPTDP
jgi:tetratricopeptide (TPR) repeat protein